ncbi:MAG: hypothetical protein MR216_05110 [Bacteroidales bacterium]|nr:hypothetical protein [Bacteroidales bacterium]MDD6744680.1 hypothetical protein [Bacteroidales bacterium]
MIKNRKTVYTAPQTQVVKVNVERLCDVGVTTSGVNEEDVLGKENNFDMNDEWGSPWEE